MADTRDPELSNEGMGKVSGADHRWVAIQKKTFINWCNEQLSAGGRSVEDLDTDFCDGVKVGVVSFVVPRCCCCCSCRSCWSPRAHFRAVMMLRFMSDINQPSLPTPFFILFLCLFLSLLPFQLYFIS